MNEPRFAKNRSENPQNPYDQLQYAGAPMNEIKEEDEDLNLILNDNEISWLNALKEILTLSKDPLLGYLCTPVILLVDVAVCNQLGDQNIVAGFGLGALTCGIMIENPSQGFSYAVARCVAHSYGKGDLRTCKIYRNQFIFLSTCVMAILCVPLIFIPYLLAFIG